MQALQNKPLRHRNLDIHYSIPKDNPSDKDINQGSIVIYNLDSTVSNDELHHIFGVYGEIKEIFEGSRHKSIEFCDIRSAKAALRELNKSEMEGGGKQMKLDADETSALLQMCSPPPPTDFIRGKSGTVSNVMEHSTSLLGGGVSGSSQLLDTNSFSSMIGVESDGSLQNQLKYDFRNTPPPPNYHPHSLPDGLTNSILANSLNTRISERLVGNRQQFNRIGGRALELNNNNDNVFGNAIGGSPASHHYTWNPSHHNMMWPNSPSLMNGLGNAHSLPRPQSAHNMMTANTAYMHINNHKHHHHHVVGSAPSVNSSIWDCRRQQHSSSSYAAGESPDTTLFHPGSLGNMRNSPHHHHPIMDFVSHNNIFHPPPPRLGGGGDLPIPSKNISHHQNSTMFPSRGGQQMIPMMTSSSSSSDSPSDGGGARSRSTSNQGDNKKQFELDLDRILRGEDRRTTLMIKNIPNKYTSKMLLAAIDELHRGTYDFIYLPIDFKNKCNVGYAFINMTEPTLIVPFFQAFNGKKWEKFNSEIPCIWSYTGKSCTDCPLSEFKFDE